MSLRKFFSSATTSRQDEDATSGDDPGPSKKRCTNAPPSTNRSYKKNLRFNPEWKAKWQWMIYDEHQGVCFVRFAQSMGNHPSKLVVLG